MGIATNLITADELLLMPDCQKHCELVKGELRKTSPTGGERGITVAKLTIAIGHYVEENGLGEIFGAETDFKLSSDPDTVRAPDVAFIRKERIPAGDFSEKFWDIVPDLTVEVVSPCDRVYEVEEKIEDYLRAGVCVVLVVNPRRKTVSVYHSGQERTTLTEKDALELEDILPGFRYELSMLFRKRK